MKCSCLLQVKGLLFLLLGFQYGFSQAQPRCTQNARVGLANGETTLVNCLDDDENRVFRLRSRPLTAAFAYLITDEEDIVLDVSTKNFLDLESYGAGTFRVYSFSYIGDILIEPGQNATTTELAEFCYGLSRNFLLVTNLSPSGGEVMTAEGETTVYTCPGDGNPDVVNFVNDSSNPFYSYVVTDETNTIIALPEGDAADFEDAPAGICRVFGVAHLGEFSAELGQNIADLSVGNTCSSVSSNYVEVIRSEPEGGTVSLDNGETSATLCLGPQGAETLTFASSVNTGIPFVFVVTDEENIILEVLDGATKDFSAAGPGTCRIWGLAYTGSLTAQVGDDAAATTLSDDCFDLSDNYVEVVRSPVDGGSVSLTDGSVSALICVGDGVADVLEFTNTSTASDNYTYIITDGDGIILDQAAGGSADFEGAGPGICRVYGLSFSGEFNLNAGSNLADAVFTDKCFELSENSIEVIRQEAEGGNISLADGSSTTSICTGDGVADALSVTIADNTGENFTFIITDDNNNILDLTESGSIDFEGTPPGICRIWGLAYFGNLLATAGDPLETTLLADRCFDLTDGFVEVNRILIDGGSVSLADGSNFISVCVNDGRPDEVTMTNVSGAAENYTYLITNDADELLDISDSGIIDFDAAPGGDCRVYGVSFSGNLTIEAGQNVTDAAIADFCFELSDNFVTVNRIAVSGGQVAFVDGGTVAYTCPGDGIADVVSFEATDAFGDNIAFLITDENNTILAIDTTGSQDFEGAPAGICRIWGFAYTGNLTADTGQVASEIALSDACFDLSDNFAEVIRAMPNGGRVAMPNGDTTITICPNDGVSDLIEFDSSGTSNSPFAYVITNDNNIVLGVLANGDSNDFDTAPAGVCRVWGLAYTGNLSVVTGDNILISLLSDDCFDVSDNFIEVNREIPAGGSFSLDNGAFTAQVCPNGTPNVLSFVQENQVGSSFAFLVLNSSSEIVAISDSNSIDFDPFPVDNYMVAGLAYNGDLNIGTGDIFDAGGMLTTGCWDVSSTTVTVRSLIPDAGELVVGNLSEQDNLSICGGSGMGDVISFLASSTDQVGQALVLTDENDIVIGVVNDDAVDFGTVMTGTIRVRKVFYTGVLNELVGQSIETAALSTDCADLTDNFITVFNTQVDGGNITNEFVQSNDNIFICSDGEPDVLSFTTSSQAADSDYRFIITTNNDITLALIEGAEQDFEGTGFDELRVWGVSFSGELTFSPGQNITEAVLSDGCFALSDNFLNVISAEPEGGSIATAAGDTSLIQCVGAVPDVLELTTTSESQAGYVYLLTDTNNVVISVHEGSGIDFHAQPVATYRIWGLSYTGALNDLPGNDAAVTELASGCFELSAGFIEVFRAPAIDGGTLSILFTESDTAYTCPGDGISDLVIVETTSEDFNYQFTITDTNNIVRIPNPGTNVINFEGAGAGTWRIWGIAYNGNISLQFGDDLLDTPLSDSCWTFSSNFLTVINQAPEGGSVFTTDGDTIVTVTVGDGEDDIVPFFNENTSDALYTYLITDENNNIIGFAEGSAQNFEGAGPGVCRVWGLSYTGNLMGQPGDNAAEIALSDDCFDLSDNFITVNRVTTGGLPIEAIRPDNDGIAVETPIRLTVSPNPVDAELNLVYDIAVPEKETSEILLYNAAGQLIKRSAHATFAGRNQLLIDVRQYGSGIYLLVLRNGQQMQLKKFAKR